MTSDFCLLDRYVTIGGDDLMSEQTAREIELHNLIHERLCEGRR